MIDYGLLECQSQEQVSASVVTISVVYPCTIVAPEIKNDRFCHAKEVSIYFLGFLPIFYFASISVRMFILWKSSRRAVSFLSKYLGIVLLRLRRHALLPTTGCICRGRTDYEHVEQNLAQQSRRGFK